MSRWRGVISGIPLPIILGITWMNELRPLVAVEKRGDGGGSPLSHTSLPLSARRRSAKAGIGSLTTITSGLAALLSVRESI